eukprot:5397319-Pleurochrysis_carterae.AAC.1
MPRPHQSPECPCRNGEGKKGRKGECPFSGKGVAIFRSAEVGKKAGLPLPCLSCTHTRRSNVTTRQGA